MCFDRLQGPLLKLRQRPLVALSGTVQGTAGVINES
jgi:hypothetical protein